MWKLGRIVAMFRKELLLAWAVLRDPRTPNAAKLTTVLAILYVISPVDLVSDFIPILGWVDDGLIAYFLLQLAFKFLPPDLLAALRSPARCNLDGWRNTMKQVARRPLFRARAQGGPVSAPPWCR